MNSDLIAKEELMRQHQLFLEVDLSFPALTGKTSISFLY